jgi:hypothetical protein
VRQNCRGEVLRLRFCDLFRPLCGMLRRFLLRPVLRLPPDACPAGIECDKSQRTSRRRSWFTTGSRAAICSAGCSSRAFTLLFLLCSGSAERFASIVCSPSIGGVGEAVSQIFHAAISHHKTTAAEIPCSSQSLSCVGGGVAMVYAESRVAQSLYRSKSPLSNLPG